MIPLRARWIASRHPEVLGRPLHSHRIATGVLPWLLYAGILLAVVLLLWINPHGSSAGDAVIVVLLVGLLGLAHVVIADPRLVVCERGLILGRLLPAIPFSPTFVIGGAEIDPRTVCIVSSGAKAATQLGLPSFFFQFFAYPGALGAPAVLFQGPWGADVRIGRDVRRRGPVAKSLYTFSSRRAPRIADEILHLVGRCGAIPAGFDPVNGLAPIELTGRREDATAQIPGGWGPDSQRPRG